MAHAMEEMVLAIQKGLDSRASRCFSHAYAFTAFHHTAHYSLTPTSAPLYERVPLAAPPFFSIPGAELKLVARASADALPPFARDLTSPFSCEETLFGFESHLGRSLGRTVEHSHLSHLSLIYLSSISHLSLIYLSSISHYLSSLYLSSLYLSSLSRDLYRRHERWSLFVLSCREASFWDGSLSSGSLRSFAPRRNACEKTRLGSDGPIAVSDFRGLKTMHHIKRGGPTVTELLREVVFRCCVVMPSLLFFWAQMLRLRVRLDMT